MDVPQGQWEPVAGQVLMGHHDGAFLLVDASQSVGAVPIAYLIRGRKRHGRNWISRFLHGLRKSPRAQYQPQKLHPM